MVTTSRGEAAWSRSGWPIEPSTPESCYERSGCAPLGSQGIRNSLVAPLWVEPPTTVASRADEVPRNGGCDVWPPDQRVPRSSARYRSKPPCEHRLRPPYNDLCAGCCPWCGYEMRPRASLPPRREDREGVLGRVLASFGGAEGPPD